MNWMDIACIVFVCVTVNHLGLIRAVIGVFFKKRKTLPIVSCPKCLTFWCVFVHLMTRPYSPPFWEGLGVGFISAYIAIWLELLEGIIDHLYNYIYGKIYPTANTTYADAERA